jgi:parallel beta-helix repeat protein
MYLYYSIYYTITNNTCNSNDIGISLEHAHSNTLVNNICNYNRIGIRLDDSYPNVVVNNIFLGNTEHDILGEYITEEEGTEGFDSVFLLLIGPFVGIIMLVGGWKQRMGG